MMLTMVKCSIQTHILEILQKSASLIGIIQTYISNLWYSNLNNILIWSKQSINWCGDLIWVPKHYIKISNGYDKGRIYIVYKCLHLSHSSIQCYLNIEVFHTYQHVRTHMHVKFEHQIWIKYDGAILVTEEQIVFVTDMWVMCEPRRGWVHASGT